MRLVTCFAAIAMGSCAAVSLAAEVAVTTKQIGIRPQASAAIVLDVRAAKANYRVDEAIKLRARVSKPAYVYVYTRDADTNFMTMIYPSRVSEERRLPAGKWVVLPPKQEFFGDTPGNEKFVVVASARPVDVSRRIFADQGGFLRASSAEMTAAFGEKGIRLRDETPDKTDQWLKVVNVRIEE